MLVLALVQTNNFKAVPTTFTTTSFILYAVDAFQFPFHVNPNPDVPEVPVVPLVPVVPDVPDVPSCATP